MPTAFKFKPFLFSPFHKSKSSPPLRIADVLLLQEHEEESLLLMDGCRGLNCATSRRFAARLLSGLKRGKVKRRIVGDRKEDDDDEAPHDGTDGHDSSKERCRREVDFNVGIGCCLLHMIAESKNELQKMTELRIQMEGVLQNAKEELGNKDLPVAKKIESNDGVQEGLGFNSNPRSNKVLFDQSLKCDDVPDDCLEGMDRLEAELEAELERLQLHLDSGNLPTNPPQETVEESTINSTVSSRSYGISCGEEIDPAIDCQEEDCSDSQSGVPPFELERKLHELLETRQQEQIRELEDALGRARQELREREREISWWKDAAHLLSRHVKEPSRLDFHHGQHTHHFSRSEKFATALLRVTM
ncbi:PREDICTED: protein POLAR LOCALIZATION DURING ASYMMETRIC DIVISION AND REDISTRIBUTION [Theobroma cacao]|uniref:Protein POLAR LOCALIZATION DURING ASYMMETRIC DIVISION AND REDISTRIBUTION n=1 Tax=Theobroma cacao TaxID=3641 RepID=A0AB32UND2_THECC|nr:PREDICTED: protein POLAR LOCALIZATION DURING ASYMMETRIC DIVISION AND REDISTRIBUTION [Theobroma cacao]